MSRAAYLTRPLSDRTWLRPQAQRVPTRFSAKWLDTLDLLYREVDMLDGRDLVIEVDLTEADLRLDGTIRAKARASSPAVIVSFESKHGPLMYRCDRFYAQYSGQPDDWQQNVRAIALTLESLRAVDRYGATASGQQYAGWKAIGATPAVITPLAAWTELRDLAGLPPGAPARDERIIGLARRNAHPDTGGTREQWDRFHRAYGVVRP